MIIIDVVIYVLSDDSSDREVLLYTSARHLIGDASWLARSHCSDGFSPVFHRCSFSSEA